MNIVFGIIITACVGYMLFTAPQSVMPALLSGGEASVSFFGKAVCHLRRMDIRNAGA